MSYIANRGRMTFNRQLVFAGCLPGLLSTFILLFFGKMDLLVWLTWVFAYVLAYFAIARVLISNIEQPWHILSNILLSIKEGDYTINAPEYTPNDSIGIAMQELNTIVGLLKNGRITMEESRRVLSKILADIDVAVFVFNNDRQLVLTNTYASHLYRRTEDSLVGENSDTLSLSALFIDNDSSHRFINFPERSGRWLIKKNYYREKGERLTMFLLTDVESTLREEELIAWQRLIRILAHEINNAMTPMKTTVSSLSRFLKKSELHSTWREDFQSGLMTIDRRVVHLERMVKSYTQMGRTPKPIFAPVNINHLFARILASFNDISVSYDTTVSTTVMIDESQIEQVLVNLLKNAVEACQAKPRNEIPQLDILCCCDQGKLLITVKDNGAGIENEENLFVPFFTTKEEGNGIGLLVSRQIVEAHGGQLALENRDDKNGCKATIVLPMSADQRSFDFPSRKSMEF